MPRVSIHRWQLSSEVASQEHRSTALQNPPAEKPDDRDFLRHIKKMSENSLLLPPTPLIHRTVNIIILLLGGFLLELLSVHNLLDFPDYALFESLRVKRDKRFSLIPMLRPAFGRPSMTIPSVMGRQPVVLWLM
jgi:hypothetical protein